MRQVAFDMKAFGRRLHQSRKARGLSQEALAALMDVKQPWISELEHGGQKDLQVTTLLLLSQELGVSADYLLGLTDTPARAPRPRRQRLQASAAAVPEDDGAPCPYCGEPTCEASCTAALVSGMGPEGEA